MAQLGQVEQIYDSGWLSGVALTTSVAASHDTYLSVYVAASGAGGPPVAAKLQDQTIGAVTIATLLLPAINGVALNMLGPTISGSNVANSLGYFNANIPIRPVLQVQHSASATAWYRVIVTGR
jgi:hypothetical protein